jgi:hypothetical protein
VLTNSPLQNYIESSLLTSSVISRKGGKIGCRHDEGCATRIVNKERCCKRKIAWVYKLLDQLLKAISGRNAHMAGQEEKKIEAFESKSA